MVSLTEITKQVRAKDPLVRRKGAAALQSILSRKFPPIDETLRLNLLPDLIQMLKGDDARTQLSAAWALTNVAAGNERQTSAAAAAGAIPALVSLLQSDSLDVKEQAIWALSNFVSASVPRRDSLLHAGAVPPVVGLVLTSVSLDGHTTPTMLRTCCWALSNFCKGNPTPHFPLVHPAVKAFGKVVAQSRDADAVASSSWGLAYLTSGNRGRQAARMYLPGMMRRLVSPNVSHQIVSGLCRVAGNMASGSEGQTSALVKANFFQAAAFHLPRGFGKAVLKELCYTISNICVATQVHIDSAWKKGVMEHVCQHLDGLDRRDGVQKEILYAILHVSRRSSRAQISTLVRSFKILSRLPSIVLSSDGQVVELGLEVLACVLSAEELPSSQVLWEDLCEKTGNFDAVSSVIERGPLAENYEAALRVRTLFFFYHLRSKARVWCVISLPRKAPPVGGC